MESKNTKVLEALQMQPLSEEEKTRRHILGRLWGPIATSKEKTRNGRGYNAELWRKALADEIFCEKVANKSLFLELGHPIDREETDMRMVCACIPELPKIIDGDLYAYVDILDTKDGRLLKTLCDYGFVPGISSRGSGDIMANDDVDPETFFLETWDIVQLPAVKKARLAVCESLNNKKALSTALQESLAQMSSEERQMAEATLDRLGVDYNTEESKESDLYADIPWGSEEEPLLEDTTEVEAVLEPEEDERAEPNIGTESLEDSEAEKIEEAEAEADEADEAEDIENPEESTLTIQQLIKNLSEFDDDLVIEFNPIELEDSELTINEIILDDEDEEGKIKISFDYDLETSDNIEDEASSDEKVEIEADEENNSSDEEPSEAEDAPEEAIDNGEDEVIESLKEMVRQKNALEEEVSTLKSRLAVCDAEVGSLTEELQKYKKGFIRVSELASKSIKLQKEVTSLNEQLTAKDATIHSLEQKAKVKLTESAERTNKELKTLQERLITAQNEAEATEQELKEQVEAARKNTREATTVAKAYKQKYVAVVEHYIASKAKMLGVSTRDITSRLQEDYTLKEVDEVCETLLNAGRPAFGLGLGNAGMPKVKLSESVNKKQSTEGGYEIDDDLLILAGLK